VGSGKFVNLRDGSIDWPRVRRALADIGYADFVTVELGGGDEAYLRDVSAAWTRFWQAINQRIAGCLATYRAACYNSARYATT
jgi:hypothetical protein